MEKRLSLGALVLASTVLLAACGMSEEEHLRQEQK